MPINKEQVNPPMIGKIGPYTVFVTPPSTPNPSSDPPVQSSHPVHPPPVQYPKSDSAHHSKSGFFWDAVTKVQNVHSSLDEYVARWFGLNQSKYQWALDDYYEKKGVDKVDAKVQDISTNKAQVV
ncbi:uncharacterized protein [Rutidosis leptorrhynchoides]|uniref:uncharacterized protein n=1 Tax=Rutidosis leptorrhynchoides TaxID=125765 RepID=UPI003A99AD68